MACYFLYGLDEESPIYERSQLLGQNRLLSGSVLMYLDARSTGSLVSKSGVSVLGFGVIRHSMTNSRTEDIEDI